MGKSTDYIDGFVYENGVLAYFSMPEGRVRNTGTELKPEYMIQQRYDKMMERQNSRGEWNEYLGQYMPTEKEVNDVIAKYGVTYSITPEIASAMAGRNMTYENGELGYCKNTGVNFLQCAT
nr:hypothetical protein [Pedobacter sp. ASV19]